MKLLFGVTAPLLLMASLSLRQGEAQDISAQGGMYYPLSGALGPGYGCAPPQYTTPSFSSLR